MKKYTITLTQSSLNVLTEINKQHRGARIDCETIVGLDGSFRINGSLLTSAKIKVNVDTGHIYNCKSGSYTFHIQDGNRR